MRTFTIIVLLLLISSLPYQSDAQDAILLSQEWQGKVVKVHDGVTLDITRQDGQVEQVRLGAVSAPADGQLGAEAAKKRTLAWCHQWNNEAKVIPVRQDKSGHILARVIVGQEDLANVLAKACLAEVDTELCKKDFFPECVEWHAWELQCRDEKKGLWAE